MLIINDPVKGGEKCYQKMSKDKEVMKIKKGGERLKN